MLSFYFPHIHSVQSPERDHIYHSLEWLTGAKRREWMGCWGLLGLLLLVIMDHSRNFPAFSTSKFTFFILLLLLWLLLSLYTYTYIHIIVTIIWNHSFHHFFRGYDISTPFERTPLNSRHVLPSVPRPIASIRSGTCPRHGGGCKHRKNDGKSPCY